MKRIILISTILILFAGCSDYDNDFYPYKMTGLNVHIYNDDTRKEYYGGFVEAKYSERFEALSGCQSNAASVARQYHLKKWSYVCCTVTKESGCVTKVK